MVEDCDFDPIHKEFVIRYTPSKQKEISSHQIMSKMRGYKIINQNALNCLKFKELWVDVFSKEK